MGEIGDRIADHWQGLIEEIHTWISEVRPWLQGKDDTNLHLVDQERVGLYYAIARHAVETYGAMDSEDHDSFAKEAGKDDEWYSTNVNDSLPVSDEERIILEFFASHEHGRVSNNDYYDSLVPGETPNLPAGAVIQAHESTLTDSSFPNPGYPKH